MSTIAGEGGFVKNSPCTLMILIQAHISIFSLHANLHTMPSLHLITPQNSSAREHLTPPPPMYSMVSKGA